MISTVKIFYRQCLYERVLRQLWLVVFKSPMNFFTAVCPVRLSVGPHVSAPVPIGRISSKFGIGHVYEKPTQKFYIGLKSSKNLRVLYTKT
jgi:hypothetical protein